MDLIDRLCHGARVMQGEGVNHEAERFRAELHIEPLVDGRAMMLRYRAALDDGSLVHEECTLLGLGPTGALCLWPVMAELPVVMPHEHRPALAPTPEAFVFSSGDRDDQTAFREEITIAFGPDRTLTYAHAWGLPGEAFGPRSSACLRASHVAGDSRWHVRLES